MVDNVKKNGSHKIEQNEQLRKNFKTISSNNSNQLDLQSSISNLSDTIKVSVDAIRTLSKAYESKDTKESIDIASENRFSAYATPEDVVKIKENAKETGSAIQFNKESALSAHGDELDSYSVIKLLQE